MKKVSLLILVSMILLLAFTSCDVLPETVTGPLNNVKDTVVTTFNNVKNTVVGTFNNVKDKVEIAIGTHEHEWNDATCTSPKTCRCGETQGEALGHDYSDATCYEPQTCKNCGETLGIELVHNWVSATCTDPKTCLRCGLTEGEALGHDWKDATCTKPSTCSRCKETSGEPNGHTIVGATCTEPQHCTVCGAVGQDALGHDYSGATCQNPESKCTRCGDIEENPEIKHTNLVHMEAVEPGCHYDGNVEYWHCYDCEGVWTDEALTVESDLESVVVPATGEGDLHHFEAVEPGCHYDGNVEYWHCYTCEQVWIDAALTQLSNVKNVVVPATGEGNLVHVEAVEPGCHYEGNVEYWICYTCEQVWTDAALTELSNVKNVILPELGGDLVHVEALEAGCHQNGNLEYWYCENCEQVWTDEARTQLSNFKNVVVPYNAENIIYVEAKDANCTDTNGNYEYWYCAECEAVFADAALRQLTNRLNLTIPYGHTWVDATCDAPKTCTRCGETEGEAIAHHTPIASFENGLIKYTCATCDESYLASVGHIYTGENTTWTFAKNNDFIDMKVENGEYKIYSKDATQNPQYMLYLPGNNRNNDGMFTDFTCANNALGVISFRAKTNLQSPMRLIVMEAREGNSSWNNGGWNGNSMDILTIDPAQDGVVNITGRDVTGNVLGSVSVGEDNWSEWIDIKVFIHLTSDNKCTILYYVNGEFANVYTRDLTDPENPQTLNDYMIESVYICGNVTGENAGVIFDDLAISYTTNSEWKFDEHEHVWAPATCETSKTCIACGLTDGDPLGHTPGEEATCTDPQICTVCEKVLVEALGHDWADAQCDAPSTCLRCGEESGDVLGHDFKDEAYVSNNDAKCEVDGTETAKCSRCDATDTRTDEGSALEHEWSVATCTTPATCSKCNGTKGEADAENHVALVRKLVDNVIVYSCDCGYTFTVKIGDYSDGTNYNGISANAPNNTTYYTTSPSKANYPVLSEGGYLEFVRKTDAEGVANTTKAQLQLWLPTTGGTNKYAAFTSANKAVGYLSFKINAYTDFNLEMKLVDNTTDYYDVNGDGVVDNATEKIRWGDLWAINDPVFRVGTVNNGKVEIKGFNEVVLTTVDVDENNYTGWVDVAIQLTLDPDTDTVIAKYFISGKYVATSSRPLTIHSNGINAVYLNSNNTAAGTGYQIDDLAFGYTAHEHDFSYVEENGTVVYTCPCGAEYLVDTYLEWNGDGSDSGFKNVPNGNVTLDVVDGKYEYIFKPSTDTAPDFSADGTQSGDGWFEYTTTTYAGGQLQAWIPSNNRGESTFEGFSCENNAVGIISFSMKTNMTRHEKQDTSLTFSVGKPRNASDWNGGLGSWADDSINIFTVEDYLDSGVVLKGGLNGTNLNLATIPVADGWSEWFDVVISIELTENEYITIYYYINGVYCGSDTRDLANPGSYRTLDPREIEALQLSGWTYAPNTGVIFDDMVFGYTVEGHNTLDGQYHKLTETNCGEKSVCSCGWTGYTLDHDLTEATCGAPATCKVCGLTEGEALTHDNLTASTANGVTTYACSDCGKQYVADSHNLYYDGSAQVGTWGVNGDVTSSVVDGYNAVINKETDGTYFNANGNQFMTWIPSQSTPAEFDGFTCANNAIGLASFKIKAYTDSNTGVEFKVNDGRGTGTWGYTDADGKKYDGWAVNSVGIFTIKPVTSADATTAEIRGLNGAALTTVPLAEGSKWTEWLDVALLIKLSDDNKISVDYYINSAFVGNLTIDMPIYTNKISSFYINGYTKGDDTGYYLDDLAFGYTLNGLQTPEEPFYTEEIAAENVTSETLKTLVASKIKQYDQCTAVNTQGGTPVYVLADKNGESVEALYFSRTYAWAGTEAEQFSEFRFAVNGEQAGPAATKISFDYKIKGSVEKNERYEFTDLKGEKFFADAYVQVKTPAAHEQAGDTYPELSGTDLILDGEWHTMTYTFDEPLVIIDVLLNLYHFQGELLISNLVIEYAE